MVILKVKMDSWSIRVNFLERNKKGGVMEKWYVYEIRHPDTGHLANFAILPDYVYRERFHKNIYKGPFSTWEAEQKAKELQQEMSIH